MDRTDLFPACRVEFPAQCDRRRASFYLAAEEYLAEAYPADSYLFSWVLPPTVVMGRNQVLEAEINFEFCRQEGIDIIRRKSGGGCIFADEGNIMFSLVTHEGAVEPVFAEYARNVVEALRGLGVAAYASGRNDVLLADGRKVCGNAFYHLAYRNIVHGTMLYDTDYRLMCGALTPDNGKLSAAGVKSVRTRTGLIKDVCPIGVERLRRELEARLCDRVLSLTTADVSEIERIEESYLRPDFLYGRRRGGHVTMAGGRVAGCGRMDIRFDIVGGVVVRVEPIGDFFATDDAEAAFSEAFAGVGFAAADLSEAVSRYHPERAVRGLSTDDLLQMIKEHFTSTNS